MNRAILKLLLVLCVLNGTLTSASALVDLCCTADEGVALNQPQDSTAETGHLPHCCHATVHLTGLLSAQAAAMAPAVGELPVAATDDRMFYAQAPPLPPPIA